MRRFVFTLALGLFSLTAAAYAQQAENTEATLEEPGAATTSLPVGPGRFAVIPYDGGATPEALEAQTRAATTIPLWNGSAKVGLKTYAYKMVGKDPKLGNSPNISTLLIPVKFVFKTQGNQVSDPTKNDPTCLGGKNALALVKTSPMFANISIPGLGIGQYASLFQRANYYTFNHTYVLKLVPKVLPLQGVAYTGGAQFGPVPCGKLFGIDIGVWDNYVRTTLIPKLKLKGVAPTTFPIFIFYNVVLYDGSASNCCILGYHSAMNNPAFANRFQTYAVANFDGTKGAFKAGDVSALGHEIAEWLADPNGINPTPPWGHIGQVTGCQSNLEVGDPLSPSSSNTNPVKAYTIGGFTYHVQDEAFTSWFYHQKPSTGFKGWYSLYGTFKTFAKNCT